MEETKKPIVSIIMNCLNCSKYLKEALDSVFAQTYKDWEIIFWDDASTDNSAEIAKGYGEKVKYFRSEKTIPLGEARNLAVEKAEGKLIAFLDCDDIWMPEKLESQVPLFENDPEVGIVFSDAIFFTNNGEGFQNHGSKKPPEGRVFRQLFKNYFMCLPTVVIRKESLVGLNEWFDNRFRQIEEADLFLRIAHGWKVAYTDKILAKYRLHKESWTFSHRECSPIEKELLIEKFSVLYPNFGEQYREEIDAMKNQIGYEKFSIHWAKGEAKKARDCFRPFLKLNKKLIPYVFSYFFPASFFYFLIEICVKVGIFKKMIYFRWGF